MRLGTLKVTMSLLIAALLAPLGLSASSQSCYGTPSAESNTWDVHREAAVLLDSVQRRAEQVRTDADRLEDLYRESSRYSWEFHAWRLSDVRDNVNKMGDELCRLQAIRSEALPWQQQAFDHVLPLAIDLAMQAESALELLDAHQGTFYALAEYSTDVDGIYHFADGIANSMSQFPEYAEARKEIQRPLMSSTASGM